MQPVDLFTLLLLAMSPLVSLALAAPVPVVLAEAGVLAVEQRVGQRAVAGGRGGGRGTVEVRLPELTPPRPQRPRPGLQAAALGLVEAGGGGAQPAGAVLARVRPAQLQYKPC